MAILKLENGTTYTELEDIARELAPLNVQLNYWAIGEKAQIRQLLSQESLTEAEKERVLESLDHYFESLSWLNAIN
jgi:1,2-dihydroxy-3-keto-5-methylthiopentene dioxygenase